MADRSLPPEGAEAPGLVCSRLTDTPLGHCGRPAVNHVMWDAESGRNGLVCEDHAIEAVTLWEPDGVHPYDPVCSIGGSLWSWDLNRCIVDLDGLPIAAHAERRIEASPVRCVPTRNGSRSTLRGGGEGE